MRLAPTTPLQMQSAPARHGQPLRALLPQSTDRRCEPLVLWHSRRRPPAPAAKWAMLSRFELIASGIDRTSTSSCRARVLLGFQPSSPCGGCRLPQLGTDRGLSQRRDVQAPRPGASIIRQAHTRSAEPYTPYATIVFVRRLNKAFGGFFRRRRPAKTRCGGGFIPKNHAAYLRPTSDAASGSRSAASARRRPGVKANPGQMRDRTSCNDRALTNRAPQRARKISCAHGANCPAFLNRFGD